MRYASHQPTDKTRGLVQQLAALGISKELICARLRIDQRTLNKYYSDDIADGRAKGLEAVGKALFHNATVEKNVIAQIFYLKAQGRWNDKPTEVNVNHTHTFLTHEERLAMLERGPVVEGEAVELSAGGDDDDDESEAA